MLDIPIYASYGNTYINHTYTTEHVMDLQNLLIYYLKKTTKKNSVINFRYGSQKVVIHKIQPR